LRRDGTEAREPAGVLAYQFGERVVHFPRE
jgi:hypothetical protein